MVDHIRHLLDCKQTVDCPCGVHQSRMNGHQTAIQLLLRPLMQAHKSSCITMNSLSLIITKIIIMKKEVLEQPVLLQCLLITATTRHVKFPRRPPQLINWRKRSKIFCLCIVTTYLVTRERQEKFQCSKIFLSCLRVPAAPWWNKHWGLGGRNNFMPFLKIFSQNHLPPRSS